MILKAHVVGTQKNRLSEYPQHRVLLSIKRKIVGKILVYFPLASPLDKGLRPPYLNPGDQRIQKPAIKTRNITEGDEYPQLLPDNIHMYEKFKGPFITHLKKNTVQHADNMHN